MYVRTRAGALAVHVSGEGPPVVLLHANPGDSRDFNAVIPALAARHRVHAVDWPGFGASPAPGEPRDLSAMAFADALEDVASALPAEPLIVVGNSVGGYVAVRLALTAPERVAALVLVNPGGFTPHNAATRMFCRIKGGERVTALTSGVLARAYLHTRTPVVREMLARAAAQRHVPHRVAIEAALWRSFPHPGHDLRAGAAAVTAPTLVVWGRRDPLLPLRKDGAAARRALPHARFVEMDTGHAAFAEDPEGFLAVVEPFLHELSEARRSGA
jgi:pimeloyl-ACP methyl ester carboxylesterase